ncbi:uncharacterized protein BP5553_07402 [Venustampulla echinocandica]|uniref:Major facilitator superfamily (MFS) profile domain-containing protein n=1 Tax=Venustampulla echinocandica TaxID=2656787 RepID=A0A370TJC7_9HELO|nr:uncharacterized protein BP5553_07402 [Venustampulla echinocandica]RDL35471.1 hypothetical protein BP5553_07402 [Venustampulla echinocandica]
MPPAAKERLTSVDLAEYRKPAFRSYTATMQRRMLSKEDEATAAAAGDEVEVRREDQDKINKFSRLHQREIVIEEELKSKHKEKEDLDDVSNELELVDEDDKVPYKIGDGFVSLPLPEVQEMLSTSTDRIEEEVAALEEKLGAIREEQEQLKHLAMPGPNVTTGKRGREMDRFAWPLAGLVPGLCRKAGLVQIAGSPSFIALLQLLAIANDVPNAPALPPPKQHTLFATAARNSHEMPLIGLWPSLYRRTAIGIMHFELAHQPNGGFALSAQGTLEFFEMAGSAESKALSQEEKCRDVGQSCPRTSGPISRLSSMISSIDESDAEHRYAIEVEDNRIPSLPASSTSSVTSSHRKVISWEDGDPENPYNWSTTKKVWIVIIGMLIVVNSTMGSALPSNAVPYICETFHVTSSYAKPLPISMYIVGYVLGPLAFGPLSETFGRQLIMISSFVIFMIFTMACALAPNWSSLLIFRLITGISASTPNTVTGGIYADMYADPVTRGRAMAIFMGGTCVGPLIAPVISGYVAPVRSWRWVFWIAMIIAGATLPAVLSLPETYGPVLLAKRAARLRKSSNNPNIFAPIDLEKKGWKQLVVVTLTRPLRMVMFELIVSATCLYLSLAYAIFYMYFTAYPIIFQGIYHQSPGVSGLMFLPIMGGSIGAIGVFLWYDAFLRKAQKQNKPWTQKEESRRLPLACLGGPLYVISLFWLGWTSRPEIPFFVPMLAGLPFGMGFVLIFMALLNYLTDAYEIFAASAMAAASCCRSIAAAVLPFAATPMYRKLGVAWATSLLAFFSLVMCVIPFAFLWKGDKLKEGSKFCIYLKEKKDKELAELERKRDARRLFEGAESRVIAGE